MSTKPWASRYLRAAIAARWRSIRFFCIGGRRRSITRCCRRTVSDRFSSSSGKGGVCAVLRISMSCASTSISPETRFGFAPPSGRSRTSPVTRITNSLRSDSAAANVSARSGLKTICTRPSRSRRSTKMTPPWSRRRCTQPISVTVVSEMAAVDASTIVSALQGILQRALRSDDRVGTGRADAPRRGGATALRLCPVNFGNGRPRAAA